MGRQVTEKKIARDQLRAVAHHAEQANSAVYLAPRDLLTLLDALDQAEAELDSWMTRAYEAEGKLWKAEARIKAVQDVLDNPIRLADWDDPLVPATHIRRALDGA